MLIRFIYLFSKSKKIKKIISSCSNFTKFMIKEKEKNDKAKKLFFHSFVLIIQCIFYYFTNLKNSNPFIYILKLNG